MSNKFKIGNLSVSNITNEDAIKVIIDSINLQKKLILMYAEMNQIVIAKHNINFAKYYSISTYTSSYGIGAYFASKFLIGNKYFIKSEVGIDLYTKILSTAKNNKWKIFFLGSDDKHLSLLRDKFKKDNIFNIYGGSHNGYFSNNDEVVKLINESNSTILFVGMGSPLQEKWVYENHSKLKTPIIITVGNAINVLSGNYHRPPKFIRKIGLEWLTRVILEPHRLFKRYFLGIPIFIAIVLKQKFFQNK